jgi:cholesterol oxidase
MPRLSLPIENLQAEYEIVVIGSGYGGAIAASRMARAGRQVCVLERGKEFQPGDYPNNSLQAGIETQIDDPCSHTGPHTGLYDLRVNDNINVFVGCGLGGTSLVNANVALRAEPWVFQDLAWPLEIRTEAAEIAAGRKPLLETGYERAEEMLKPVPYPDGKFPPLPKLTALEFSAQQMGKKEQFYRPPINVTFRNGINHVGVMQHECTRCGDCCSGCNFSAKNTLIMNYLPDAKNAGAEIYTQVSVRRLERNRGEWVVYFQLLNEGREKFHAPEMSVRAQIVVISAGTLGSTEILLRSKDSVPVSARLGEHFSGNGDVLAFAYDTNHEIDGIGYGHRQSNPERPVGPTITGIIDLRKTVPPTDGMVVEEGAIPGALAEILPEAFELASLGVGQKASAVRVASAEAPAVTAEVSNLLAGRGRVQTPSDCSAINRTQTYLVMTHDDGKGQMLLRNDRLRVSWPGVGDQAIFTKVSTNLQGASAPLNGIFVKNPITTKFLNDRLISVHPLGGCIMADNAAGGVVNHKGQVFNGTQGDQTYPDLYVIDGSIIPRPLGVNPLLTISALAERCCALIARDRNWTIQYLLPSFPSTPPPPETVGVQFTETMRGFISVDSALDYDAAAERGEQTNTSLEFTLTIIAEGVHKMVSEPGHTATMTGDVLVPQLSDRALMVSKGEFQLFVPDSQIVGARRMWYRMKLTAADGHPYHFEGYKLIRESGNLLRIWPDTSTLFITLYDGPTPDPKRVLGRGILRIRPDDFLRQMMTMKAVNARRVEEGVDAVSEFGRFFAGILYDTYGGIAAPERRFDPDLPPRQKRSLRAGVPEVHFFATADQVQLRLTRYRGGDKGPLVLSHGLGVSSQIFTIDTIDTNLLEYLFAHGYDVWLLDHRASIDLPAATAPSSGDDVALCDYPAAVDKVREVTRAPSIQMVAHCWGSTTFTMSMLSGQLQGVRSALCSQISANILVPVPTAIKTGLHFPSILDKLGYRSLTAYADSHEDWWERLFDAALRLYPVGERCNNPVCHRITFLYGPLYEHKNLNDATHEEMHEMFGVANIKAFEHLARLANHGELVDSKGNDTYMPNLKRLAIPITFIHGADNQCFLPESTEKTFQLLRKINPEINYDRHLIAGYGHIDGIFGKNAVVDVYPHILNHLEGIGR